MKKICFVSSCGGHFMELLQLMPVANSYDSYIVTELNIASKEKIEQLGRHYFLSQQERRSVKFLFTFLQNIVKSLYITIKERPSHIITTGAGAVFPICMIGKILGAKIIYVESFAKINSKSVTGKMIYKIADRFYVQWPEMVKIYPNSLYYGSVY